jgi:hypothetical protein
MPIARLHGYSEPAINRGDMSKRKSVLILGAAARDFDILNACFRDDPIATAPITRLKNATNTNSTLEWRDRMNKPSVGHPRVADSVRRRSTCERPPELLPHRR